MTHYGPPTGPEPQLPPPPYGQLYSPHQQPPTQPPMPAAPVRSQGLAITALVFGVVAVVLALTAVRLVAPVIGLIAVILGIIALVAKSQGGKMFAGFALGLGMVSLPLVLVLNMVAVNNARNNQQLQACMDEALKRGSVDEAWNCGR